MRILITGALGLIGSEIAKQLTSEHFIIGIDDESHNCIEPMESLASLLLPCRVEAFAPVSDTLDLIIHCASPIGHALLSADTAWRIVSDTRAVLTLAEHTGARLITFSSSEVLTYRGETDVRAQYSLGKLTAEAMVLSSGVDARIIRPYNVTGKKQRADGGFVLARFREQALHGQPLTIFGSGEQRRSFLHVSDFARFVLLLIEKWPEQQLWSVGNPANCTSINQLAKLFSSDLQHTDGWTALKNNQWRDTLERPLDMIDHLHCRRLGWVPEIGLEQIVEEQLTGSLSKAKAVGA